MPTPPICPGFPLCQNNQTLHSPQYLSHRKLHVACTSRVVVVWEESPKLPGKLTRYYKMGARSQRAFYLKAHSRQGIGLEVADGALHSSQDVALLL